MIIKAIPIADKTKAPAVKLAIKFANEVVLCNYGFIYIKTGLEMAHELSNFIASLTAGGGVF
jgi:hypothetical protein